MQNTEIEEKLVYKLAKDGCFGKGHRSWTSWVRRGFPSHAGKRIELVAKKLIKKGIVSSHPTHHESQVHLNTNKLPAIRAILERRRKRLGLEKFA